MKVYVAGHTGLVGTATSKALVAAGHDVWAPKQRRDLRDRQSACAVVGAAAAAGVDAVVLAAARVGGIGANSRYPVEFFCDNVTISMNVMAETYAHRIPKLVNLGSSCIYPRDAEQPMREEALLTGALEPTNEGYALAKISVLKLVQAYRRQYGARFISLMPTNLYGDNDTYDTERSHVIPSLIMKFEEARRTESPRVVLWGTGKPLREFLHADDLGCAIVLALENYDGESWLNVGSDVEISIQDLAYKVATATGYQGAICWDASRPDGTPRKKLDWSRIREALGWTPTISFDVGLRRSIADYRKSFAVRVV